MTAFEILALVIGTLATVTFAIFTYNFWVFMDIVRYIAYNIGNVAENQADYLDLMVESQGRHDKEGDDEYGDGEGWKR